EDEGLLRKVANAVLEQLRQRHPEQEFAFDGDHIRGREQVVYLSNLFREVRAAPARLEPIVKHFVESLGRTATAALGTETWEEAQEQLVPVLKPRAYVEGEGPTQHLLTME